MAYAYLDAVVVESLVRMEVSRRTVLYYLITAPNEQQESGTETTNKVKNTMTKIICRFGFISPPFFQISRFMVPFLRFAWLRGWKVWYNLNPLKKAVRWG